MRQDQLFKPTVLLLTRGKTTVLMFDSNSTEDVKRKLSTVSLPESFQSLDFAVSMHQDSCKAGECDYQISFIVDEVKPVELATLRKNVADLNPEDVKKQIEQALYAELSPALAKHLQEAVVAVSSAPQNAAVEAQQEVVGRKSLTPVLVAFSVPILVLAGVLMFMKGQPGQVQPQTSTLAAQQTTAQQLYQDPAAFEAQVELTRQTLRSMGLDPGTAADTGCFTAPTK